MNTAWSATYALWTPLQGLLRWLAPAAPSRPVTAPPSSPRSYVRTPAVLARACAAPVRRPLRVVRVMEAGQPRSQVGRMVISGRMADVCAELDRLAACEAARS
ncbi:MAG: hypothetical protein Q8R72_08650 [Hylemonella sp.]|nr:hypothetical protein [Hylemonella sp.]